MDYSVYTKNRRGGKRFPKNEMYCGLSTTNVRVRVRVRVVSRWNRRLFVPFAPRPESSSILRAANTEEGRI